MISSPGLSASNFSEGSFLSIAYKNAIAAALSINGVEINPDNIQLVAENEGGKIVITVIFATQSSAVQIENIVNTKSTSDSIVNALVTAIASGGGTNSNIKVETLTSSPTMHPTSKMPSFKPSTSLPTSPKPTFKPTTAPANKKKRKVKAKVKV